MSFEFLRKAFLKKKSTSRNDIDFKAVEKVVGHKFRDRNFLFEAFKHRSYLIVNREPAYMSNERLEFLGDAVLDLVVTQFLFHKFPHESEGLLSKIKSVLVSRKVLAQIISDMQMGQYLLMNRGEEQTGGRSRTSNLANLYESILGGLYLDGGLDAADKFISRTLLSKYENIISDQKHLNYKSILLEYAQSKGMGTPQYNLNKESGPDHEKIFEIEVNLNGIGSAQGTGKSKKIAEQNSARNLLKIVAPQLIENSLQS
jgi:ribonuclease-3